MSRKNILEIILGVLVISFVFPPYTYAYLDPGTGSYIIQLLVAGLLGAAFVFKTQWNHIVQFFKGLFGKESDDQQHEA